MTAPDLREANNVLVFPDSEDSDSDNLFFQNSSSWANFPSNSKDSTPQKPKRQIQPRRTDVFGSDVLATDPWVDFNDGFDFDYSSEDDDEDYFNTAFPPAERKSKSKGNPDGQEGTMPLRDHNRKVKKGRAKSISRGRQRRSKSPMVLTNEEAGQKRRNRSRSKPSFVAGIRTRSLSVPRNKFEDEDQKESAGSSSHSRKSVNPEIAATKSKSKPKASKSKKHTGNDHIEGDHSQPQGDRSPKTQKAPRDRSPKTPIDRSRKISRDGSLKAPKTSRDKSPKAKRDRSSKVPKAKREKASRSKSPKPSRSKSRDRSQKAPKASRSKSRDRSQKAPKASRSKSPKPSRDRSQKSPRDRSQKAPKASRSKSPKPSRDSSARSLRDTSSRSLKESSARSLRDTSSRSLKDTSSRSLRDTSSKSQRDTSSKSSRDRSRKTNDKGKSLKIKGIDKPPKTPPASKSVAKQKDVGSEKKKKPKLFASPLPVKSYLSRGTQKRLYSGVSKLMDYRKFNIKESMAMLLSDDDESNHMNRGPVDNNEDEDSAHSDPTERKRSSSVPRGKGPVKQESEHTPSSTNRRQRRHSILGAS